MRADVRFEVKGLDVLRRQMTACQGRGFQKGATRSMKKVMQTVVLPALKAAAPKGAKNRQKAKSGRQGPVASNIKVLVARKRPGEFVALKAGPRAWYAHFGIHGTKDHVIRAGLNRANRNRQGQYRPDTSNASSRRSRAANREGHVPALSVNGRFYSVVRVKGVKSSDWVTRAASGKAQQALAMLAADTMPRKDGKGLVGGN